MLKRLKAWLRRLNKIPCKCGCRETKIGKEYLLDTYGPVCEYEILCAKCGTIVNYWAYGYLEFPVTWTERFWYNWNIIKGHYSRVGDLPKC